MERSQEEILSFLTEAETRAEDLLSDKQQMIEMDRKRHKTREALRVLQKDKVNEKTWVCFGNMFLKLPTTQTKTLLKEDFDNLDTEISDLRKKLKQKVNILRDIENKEAAKGFDLSPLTKEELKSVEAVL